MTFLTHPEVLDEERLREHGADFTPMPVVRQCLTYACALAGSGFHGHIRHACDPGAGAGAWSAGMRERWPDARITAIEKREEEAVHLDRHADVVLIGDALHYADLWDRNFEMDDFRFDLVATNPDFKLFRDYADTFLQRSPLVWLFAPVEANVRGEEASEWLRDNAKWVKRCLWVPGGIGFRGPGKNAKGKPNGQDHRQYGLWMLTSDLDEVEDESGWPVTVLPRLPGADRRWKTRPGTEGEG